MHVSLACSVRQDCCSDLQRGLCRLDKRTARKHVKLNKSKCQVLHGS